LSPIHVQKGFAILIENLFSDIRILEPDDELRTEDEISEKSLRDGIKNFFQILKNIKTYTIRSIRNWLL
jgi:hypothetical protein